MQRFLTSAAFALLTLGTAVVALKVAGIELGRTTAFAQADLEAWLTADRLDETPAVMRRAARQLDRDFHTGHDWQPTLAAQATAKQTVMAERFKLLLTLLIRQRADAYRVEPPDRREAFLDRQLQEMSAWYVVGPRGKTTAIALFQQWLKEMQSPKAQAVVPPQVREFLAALQAQVVKRTLGRVLPFGGGDEEDER